MDRNFYEFSEEAEEATEKGKVLKFLRYGRNLRYDSEGIYSYGTQIANLDMRMRTIQKLGYWSPTTSKHYNYAARLFDICYDFCPIEDRPEVPEAEGASPLPNVAPFVHVQHLSYDDHT